MDSLLRLLSGNNAKTKMFSSQLALASEGKAIIRRPLPNPPAAIILPTTQNDNDDDDNSNNHNSTGPDPPRSSDVVEIRYTSPPPTQDHDDHHHHHHHRPPPVPIRRRIVHFDDAAAWMRADPHIKRGYRAESHSFAECFRSLFYLHNESVNIWSHLLPALFFLALLLLLLVDRGLGLLRGAVRAPAPAMAFLVLQIYVAGTAACLLLSALFHGANSHSESVARYCLKLDYLGIVLTISTTCISVTFFALAEQPHLQSAYIAFTALCAVAVFVSVLDPGVDGSNAAAWRAAVFTALASSGVMPLAHVALIEGSPGLLKLPLWNIAATCASYAVGTGVYVHRFPERLFPDVFDVWGSSHQIFHVLVAVGQIVHFVGIRRLVLSRY